MDLNQVLRCIEKAIKVLGLNLQLQRVIRLHVFKDVEDPRQVTYLSTDEHMLRLARIVMELTEIREEILEEPENRRMLEIPRRDPQTP